MIAPKVSILTLLIRALLGVLLLSGLGFAAFQLSPWPMVGIIRYTFGQGAEAASAALQKHVPANIVQQTDLAYLPNEPRAKLDVFSPAEGTGALPTLVWIHGGAWVSGDKSDVRNYARVLAGHGFTVVAVGYSIAPEATYPTPVRQVHAALAYLQHNHARLRVMPNHLVLAGDSAGAHIAAQVAATTVNPHYAEMVGVRPQVTRPALKGLLLYCGPYDVGTVNTDGAFGGFLRTVLWAYSGHKAYTSDNAFASASVIQHVNAAFPPSFISAGNADPLAPQSIAMADALDAVGVRTDRLIFPKTHQALLGHEYQFNLDTADGQLALSRSLVFLRSLK